MIAQACPPAEVRILGSQSQRRMLAHDIVCLHTMVGFLISTDRFFRISNGDGFRGTEAHYGVGGKWGKDLGGGLDGKAWQWQDRAYSADANYDGWDRVISIETADNAARPIQKWTPAQLDRLVDIIAWECSPAAHAKCPRSWACHQSGIPAQLIPDTKAGRRGIGYHRQGCEHSDGTGSHPGWLVKGGERWSVSLGKDCPTQARINQLEDIVIPRVQARLAEEDDVVTETEIKAIAKATADAVWAARLTNGEQTVTAGSWLTYTNKKTDRVIALLDVEAFSDEIAGRLSAKVGASKADVKAALAEVLREGTDPEA